MKFNFYIFFTLGLTVQVLGCSKKSVNAIVTPADGVHNYYVSVNGSESNKGTIDAPFQTINTALSHTVPGDTVWVRGGYIQRKSDIPKVGGNG